MNRGDRWGRYQILSFLGSGAMGEVYLALDVDGGRQVAVKRVRRSPGAEGEEKLAAERAGAELEKSLCQTDSRVTKVYWYGEIEGDLAIEMEYIDGQDLSVTVAEGPLPPGRAAVIAIELCAMLENLRTVFVVHGDLKPKNVRINSRGEIRVMDFGVAKALSRSRDYTSSLFGSVAYCSPERLDSGSMDAQSDLWSVGVMLYQTISGRLPFEGAVPERLERRIRSGEPPNPLPPECPAALRDIVFQMLARDPSLRYADATAVREDLERFLNGEPVRARTASGDATVRTNRPPVAETEATRRTVRPPAPLAPGSFGRGKNPLVAGLKTLAWAGLLLFLVLSLTAILLIRPQYTAWADTRALKRDLEAEHLNANDAWVRYQQIAGRHRLSFVMWGIGSPLKQKLVAAGDQPILDTRNSDMPTAREGQWRRSVDYFSHALELDPSDKTVKGKLRLCQAHLERITAAGAYRQQMLNDAAEKFRESAELLKKSPDPYIGLARLYAYNLNDLERAQEAQDKARKLGHVESRREITQMADGYLRRANQTLLASQKFQGMPRDERLYLTRARQDFERARDLYLNLGSYGNAPTSRLNAIFGLEQVEARLRSMGTVNE